MTNKLHPKINYGKLLERYHIYKVSNKSKNAKEYQAFYAGIRENLKPLAHAVDGRYTLIATDKSGLVKAYANQYEMKELYFAEIKKEKEYILLRLINSLLANESAYFEIENDPYGLYYLADIEKSKLLAIKISTDRDMFLSLNVTTFIKTKSLKDAYKIDGNKLVRALKKQEGVQLYKKGNYNNRKSSYRFFGLMKNSKRDLIQKSKVYILLQYLKEMKRCFSDVVTLGFHTMDTELYTNGSDAIVRKEKLQERIQEAIGMLHTIHIVNYTDKDLTQEIEELKKSVLAYINPENSLQISSSTKLKKNAYNLTITYDEDYYIKYKIDDPYIEIHKNRDIIAQNLTLKSLKKVSKDSTLLQVLLKELVIKKEIQERKLILSYHSLFQKVTFIYPYRLKDKELAFYKSITDGKSIEFTELSDYEQHICSEIAFSVDRDRVLEAILFNGDDIGYITKTKGFPLPKIYEIQTLLHEYNKPKYLHYKKILEIWNSVYKDEKAALREKLLIELEQKRDPITGEVLLTTLDLGKSNSKFKKELEKLSDKKLVLSLKGKKENRYCIDSLIGIRYSKQENKYYIGLLENIPESIEKASPIREVHRYKGNNFLDIILPMLNEYFVKNGSFTVLPYPLKYIKEYYKTEKY